MNRFAALAALFIVLSASAQTVSLPAADDPSDFAWTLYRKTATAGRNTLISPYSAREAVGLAYLGARGATADGLAQALRAGRREDFLQAAAKTRKDLAADAGRGNTVEVANSLWLRSDWNFLDSYVAKAKKGFDAEVFRREFDGDTVAETNAWVSRKTHGKIRKAVAKLGPRDAAVLLNAVYFKGVWDSPFDKARTARKDFHLASGRTVLRPRMTLAAPRPDQHDRKFDYAEDGELQAVRLPYASGRLAMIVVLPSQAKTLESLNAGVSGSWWRALRSRMQPRRGEVELPRFKFDASTTLNTPLSAMGANLAFDRGHADFQDMAVARKPEEMLSISRVEQKAVIEVDEEGTVAAAETSVLMHALGAAMEQPEPPFRFVADRPFLFAIEDDWTGTLLFVGSVQDPR